MAMASVIKLILGSIAFVIFWMLAVFPAVPFLPIGRTAGSLFGAVLMVIFQVITADEAYDAIDLSILGLLFGTMVVGGYLERAGGFNHLGKLLSWKSQGGKDLICRICIISAISSALFTNDTSCMVLTEYVLKIAMQNNLPPHPFLLALALSANIGSAATPIGNPQNLVIATESGISFWEFLAAILPSAALGIVVNALLLLYTYWDVLSMQKNEEHSSEDFAAEESVDSYQFSPATMSNLASTYSPGQTLRYASESEIHLVESVIHGSRNSNASQRWKEKMWKASVYSVIVGMLIALLMGLNMSWTAITAALALIVLDFKDGMPCLEKVSYPLLIFFCGMFITVEGFNRTGIPNTLWEFLEPYARIDEAIGVAILGFVILILSNVISNVPTVLLLGARIVKSAAMIDSAYIKKAWLILAWLSTVAGNLSLAGSAANLIVCEQARRVPHQGTEGSLFGAVPMAMFEAITADDAYDAVDLSILRLLFGTMVVSRYLEQADTFSSALFNNDTTCMILTEFVLKIARQNNLPPDPFLLALASTANIGSTATPIVLLLGGRVAASTAAISPSHEKKAWLILAWVSTVAGNLSLSGSAANLIFCEQARRAPHLGYTLSFWNHLKFGVPSTLIVTAIGLTVIR